ncbi:hypothetical protein BaRGS_00023272 [Batillaria attramentaria]|uniref:Uncharacterized protein n=1 Tax=Batillaria attramentaria TaxID=370345 RepID=A0ABD0KEP3_9CAEN
MESRDQRDRVLELAMCCSLDLSAKTPFSFGAGGWKNNIPALRLEDTGRPVRFIKISQSDSPNYYQCQASFRPQDFPGIGSSICTSTSESMSRIPSVTLCAAPAHQRACQEYQV